MHAVEYRVTEYLVKVNQDIFPPANAITPYPEATNITVGNEYYSLVRWLPAGLHFSLVNRSEPLMKQAADAQEHVWSGASISDIIISQTL